MRYLDKKQFEKLEFRIGKIKGVKRHPKSKEYILLIDLGKVEPDVQIVADLKDTYTLKSLIGIQVVYIVNMKPVMVQGVESQGMLLIAHKKGKPILIGPHKKVSTGVKSYGVNDSEHCRYVDRTR